MAHRGDRYLNKTMELLASSKKEFIKAVKRGFGFFPVKKDPTDKDFENLRNQVDNLKAKFEKRFKPKFNKWQSKTISYFMKELERGSTILILSQELKDELKILLINHWQEVAEAFVPGVEFERKKEGTQSGKAARKEDEEIDLLVFQLLRDIEVLIERAFEGRMPVHAGSIINTTERIGNNALSLSQGDLFDARAIMTNKMAGRSTTVAVTETQWIAEDAQNIALEVTTPIMSIATRKQLKDLQSISPNIRLKTTDIDEMFEIGTENEIDLFRRQLSNPQKMWATMGDGRVRPSHKLVDGQTVGINEAFTLPGGKLLYPSDSSLGASFEEIVGCRCHAIYF